MKKISALLFIILMLGPTVAMASSCCPQELPRSLNAELSASDCCCLAKIVKEDLAGINQISVLDLVSAYGFLNLSALSSVSTVNHRSNIIVPLNSDESPHRLGSIPLYLSNLVLRF